MSRPRLHSFRTHRSRPGRAAAAVALGLAVLIGTPAQGAPGGAHRGGTAPRDTDFIVVVDIDGLLDPVTADLIEGSVREAEHNDATLVILAVNSSVAVDVDLDGLVKTLDRASVPIVAWVKGGGSVRGGPARVIGAADIVAKAGNARLDGRADIEAPTLRDLIALLDGRTVEVDGAERVLRLGLESGDDEQARQVLPIQFRELDLVDQAQHALTSPFVTYLLLMLGLCLIVFEFFAIGIGVAAAAGALLVLGAFVGLAHLPFNGVSLALIVSGILGIAVDVQAGASRFWAIVGSLMVLIGSLRLYDGPSALDPPVWQVLLVFAGALLFLLPGLAAMIRARFSTPTIGREWMVGESGTAEVAFDQDGVVVVRGAPWRARSTRAARIAPGEAVTVTAIRGLVLEVEPQEASPNDAPNDAPNDPPDDPPDEQQAPSATPSRGGG